MITVGVTGGIGSGKTTVCNVWKSLGAYILNADELAKEIMTSDVQVISAIKDTFGDKSYNEDGSLNREYLAKEAFSKGRVKELNAIVHPKIPGRTKKIMDTVQQQGYKMFVYEAALLLQKLRPKYLDYIVLVLADQKQRMARVKERDNVSGQQVLERMEKQQDFSELKHLADVVLDNNGTLEELKNQAERIYYELLAGDIENN